MFFAVEKKNVIISLTGGKDPQPGRTDRYQDGTCWRGGCWRSGRGVAQAHGGDRRNQETENHAGGTSFYSYRIILKWTVKKKKKIISKLFIYLSTHVYQWYLLLQKNYDLIVFIRIIEYVCRDARHFC